MALNVNEDLTNSAENGKHNLPLARMVNSFVPYIEQKIARLNVPGLDRDDLRQEAFVALFSAVEAFDESRGAGFSTYAIACINNRLADAVKAAARQKNRPLNDSLSLSDDDHPLELVSPVSPEEKAIVKE